MINLRIPDPGADRRCPQCQEGHLVQRHNKRSGSQFYGCSRFPTCRFASASLDRLGVEPKARPIDLSELAKPFSNGTMELRSRRGEADDALAEAIKAHAAAVQKLAEAIRYLGEAQWKTAGL
jgi:ssDNA-binding Zn-finger/Zn-ribbon topoisomerase 1